jgi:hypothetical protein
MSNKSGPISRDEIEEKLLYYKNGNFLRKKERWGIDVLRRIGPGELRSYEQCVDVKKLLGVVYDVYHWSWEVVMPEGENDSKVGGFRKGNVGEKSES